MSVELRQLQTSYHYKTIIPEAHLPTDTRNIRHVRRFEESIYSSKKMFFVLWKSTFVKELRNFRSTREYTPHGWTGKETGLLMTYENLLNISRFSSRSAKLSGNLLAGDFENAPRRRCLLVWSYHQQYQTRKRNHIHRNQTAYHLRNLCKILCMFSKRCRTIYHKSNLQKNQYLIVLVSSFWLTKFEFAPP